MNLKDIQGGDGVFKVSRILLRQVPALFFRSTSALFALLDSLHSPQVAKVSHCFAALNLWSIPKFHTILTSMSKGNQPSAFSIRKIPRVLTRSTCFRHRAALMRLRSFGLVEDVYLRNERSRPCVHFSESLAVPGTLKNRTGFAELRVGRVYWHKGTAMIVASARCAHLPSLLNKRAMS